jgi:hypothetical protein
MAHGRKDELGIRRLIKKYINGFRIPENLNHYSHKDFEKAQKQFVKHCLKQGYFIQEASTAYEK